MMSVEKIEETIKADEHRAHLLEFLCATLNIAEEIEDEEFVKLLKLK